MEPIAKKMRCTHKPISWPLLQATPLGVHFCDVAGQVVVDAVDKEGAAALWGIDAGGVVAGVGIVGAGGLAGGASDFVVPANTSEVAAYFAMQKRSPGAEEKTAVLLFLPGWN